MAGRIRALDWSKTPLGPIAQWSSSLATAVRILLASHQPMTLWWGSERITLYNDACRSILGEHHPYALGCAAPRPTEANGGEVHRSNAAVTLVLEPYGRHGGAEERHYSVSSTDLPDADEDVAGVLCTYIDETAAVVAERRMELLVRLANSPAEGKADGGSLEEAGRLVLRAVATDRHDLPFAMIYRVDDEARWATLVAASGFVRAHDAAPEHVPLTGDVAWPIGEALRSSRVQEVTDLDRRWDDLPIGAWDRCPHRAVVVPTRAAEHRLAVILGLNPHLPFDDAHRAFAGAVGVQVGASITNAIVEARPAGVRRHLADGSVRFRILAAVDGDDAVDELRALLTRAYDLTFVRDGREALESVRASHPDLVIAEVSLPGRPAPPKVDGLELTRALRSDEEIAHVPVLLFSAPGGESIRATGLEAGADDVVARPFEASVLRARIAAELSSIENFRDAVSRERSMRQEARTLSEISRELMSELDPQAVLQKVTDVGKQLTGAAFGAFFYNTFDDDGDGYRLYTLSGAPRDEFDGFGAPRATPLFGPTFRGEGVVRLDDVLADPRYGRLGPHHGLPAGHLQVRSYLAMPVILRSGDVLGGLFFGHPDVGVFTDDAERVVSSIAEYAAIALDNGRLYARAKEELDERVRAEDALRDSEARFRSLAQNAPAAIFVKDLDGRYTLANPLACEALGRTAGVEGLTDYDLLPADVAEGLRENDVDVAESGRPMENEEVVRRAGFERRYLSVKFPLRDARGAVVGVCGVAIDVTERTKVEQERERLAFLVERSTECIGVCDAGLRTRYVNRAGLQLVGLHSLEKAERTDMLDFFFPDDREFVANEFFPHVMREENAEVEIRFRHFETGAAIWVICNATVLRDESGTVLGLATMSRDITTRREMEAARQESEARFRMLADSIPQLAWIARPDGFIDWYNQRWYDYTGTRLEEVRGWGWMSVHDPADLPRVLRKFKEHVASGEPWEDTFLLRRGDGQMRWHLSRARPRRDENGDIVLWFGTNTDVTEQRRMEQTLREADERKNEFLATLAHELRNPLAPICSGIEILRRVSEPDWIVSVRATMDRQAQHLLRLVDDLLDAARITQGKIELQWSVVPLTSVFEAAIEAATPSIEQGRHELVVNLPDEAIHLRADATRLAQVLANLLNNAAKFMKPRGRIEIGTERRDSEIVVTVRDYGVGIPREMLEHVFDMFRQVDRSLERTTGGLGVGLTLARKFVAMHGGTIEARSEGLDRGSEFVVRLPLGNGEPARPEPLAPPIAGPPLGPLRVLVVDDNEAAARLLGILLNDLGHHVDLAFDGLDALAAAEARHPDVVLMDIGMPILSGYDTARQLRKTEWGRAATLIAVTGWGQDEDLRRTQEAGFDHHLVKPLEMWHLERILGEIRARRR